MYCKIIYILFKMIIEVIFALLFKVICISRKCIQHLTQNFTLRICFLITDSFLSEVLIYSVTAKHQFSYITTDLNKI